MSNTDILDRDLVMEETLRSIDAYTESVIRLLDIMESEESNSSSVTYENTDSKENTKILDKIKASVKKIFDAMITGIQKGKVTARGTIQASKLTKLATIVKNHPNITVKIQDVWSYSRFVDDLIDEHVRKFKRKNTLNLFDKLIGTGRAIDALIGNLDLMSEQMTNPKNKQFVIKGGGFKNGRETNGHKVSKIADTGVRKAANFANNHKIITGAGVLAARGPVKNAVTGAVKGVASVAPSAKLITGEIIKDKATEKVTKVAITTASGNIAKIGGNMLVADVPNVTRDIVAVIGASGPLLTNTALIIGGAVGLLAISKVFTNCPRKIGVETITVKELYQRLVTLAPQKFPSIIKADLQNAGAYLTRTECLQEFALTNGGTNSAVEYSRKISHLLTSYARFRQSMIDFYLSIVYGILSNPNVNANRLYSPNTMVSLRDN